jgi:hypothetical protein
MQKVVKPTIPEHTWIGYECSRFQNNWHMKVTRLSALCTGRLNLQEIFLVLFSVGGWVYSRVIVRPEGLFQRKIPIAPSGIETTTFRHVVQCLNQSHNGVPTAKRRFFVMHYSIHNQIFKVEVFQLQCSFIRAAPSFQNQASLLYPRQVTVGNSHSGLSGQEIQKTYAKF